MRFTSLGQNGRPGPASGGCQGRIFLQLETDRDIQKNFRNHEDVMDLMHQLKDKNLYLRQMVESVNQSEIASIQQTVVGIIRIFNNPDATIKDLQEIIEVDPPLTVKLLKAANSAYYSALQPVVRIEEAVLRIGFEALKELALSQKLSELFNGELSFHDYSPASLWKHSVAVGLLGKMIYRMEFREKGDNVYTAGLLHEIGMISEDQLRNQDFREAIQLSREKRVNLVQAESRVLGFHHAELAREITMDWGLPEELSVGLAYHHDPDSAPPGYLRFVSVLYVADHLCQQHQIGYCDSPYSDRKIYQQCLKRLNMEPYMLDLILEDMLVKLSGMEKQGLI